MYKQTMSVRDIIRSLQVRAHRAGALLVNWCAVEETLLKATQKDWSFDPRHIKEESAGEILKLAEGEECSLTIEVLAAKFPFYRPEPHITVSAVAA